MSKKLLITGGSGLVGSCFDDNAIKVSSSDYDLTVFSDALKMVRENAPDCIIHCAARVGGLGSNMQYKGDFFRENILINTNVIEAARLCGVNNLIAFLSTCIFPDNAKYPLTEDQLHQGPPHRSNDAYAYAKRMTDVQIRAYREQYGLNYKTVTPANMYGPRDNFNLENGHVIPSLIHKMHLAKRDGKPMHVWGSGAPLREFVFSKDVADLTLWCIDNYDEPETIIFSSGIETSIKDVVLLLSKTMDFSGDIVFDASKPDGQYRKPTDNKKIRNYLPNYKFTSLEDGLKQTVDWFNREYPNVRK